MTCVSKFSPHSFKAINGALKNADLSIFSLMVRPFSAIIADTYIESFCIKDNEERGARIMSTRRKILVIGGAAAGPKAASRARRLDQHAEITIIQKDADLSMAACGYPYYVGGTFDNRNELLATPTGVVRDPRYFLNAKGIKALTGTEATGIDRHNHTVSCVSLETGEEGTHAYDKLVIATGSIPIIPPVPWVRRCSLPSCWTTGG